MKAQGEQVGSGIYGIFRDVLRDPAGQVIWDSGWNKNAIVDDCRRVLSAFMRGAPVGALGVQGLLVGAGLAAWDVPPGPPPPASGQTSLVDPSPFLLPRIDLQFDFLAGDVPSPTPTNRLQIAASFGPGVPPWPDGSHASATLREFGLVADLDGTPVLINYRTHPAIPKDPASTLERTIWLTF